MAIERVELARLGALTRLQQIDQERAALLAAFPELRRRGYQNGVGSPRGASSKPRRRFSAAAKRRMSAGMKKYWAKKRNAAKKPS